MERYLLDTSILRFTKFLTRLKQVIETRDLEAYIPALVHAERIRQTADKFGEELALDAVDQFLQKYQLQVLPHDREQAEAVANLWIAIKSSDYFYEKYWEKNRFDIVICAVAYATGYTLIAEDKGHHFDLVERKNMEEISRWLDELLAEG